MSPSHTFRAHLVPKVRTSTLNPKPLKPQKFWRFRSSRGAYCSAARLTQQGRTGLFFEELKFKDRRKEAPPYLPCIPTMLDLKVSKTSPGNPRPWKTGMAARMEEATSTEVEGTVKPTLNSTHRPLSSSFSGLPYRILNINHKKELLRGLWVNPKSRILE